MREIVAEEFLQPQQERLAISVRPSKPVRQIVRCVSADGQGQEPLAGRKRARRIGNSGAAVELAWIPELCAGTGRSGGMVNNRLRVKARGWRSVQHIMSHVKETRPWLSAIC